MAKKGTKYLGMMNDPVVRRWLANLRRGSPVTAGVALRRLGKVCELLSMAPQELLERAKDTARFQDRLEDMVAELEARRKAPGYIAGLLKAVRSLLRYHDIVLTRRIKLSNPNATPTIENEQVPSQEELSRILRASPPRVRVAEILLAFADLRPETIGNFDGSDGLMLKDLPELRIKGDEAVFDKIPAMIIVRSSLSKARHKYFTFLSQEGCTYLGEYLGERSRAGEQLRPESPLVEHERPSEATRPFLLTTKVSDAVRECMRRAGVNKRPYVLRAYAETQLIIAESRGKISHPYLQFIAGHKGDIEARYSTNKGRLPPEMIEDMREAYGRCEQFLGTMEQPLERAGTAKEARIEAIKAVAKNLFGVDLVEAKAARERELGRGLTGDEEIRAYEEEIVREKRRHADDLMSRLLQDPEVAGLIRQKLREMGPV